MVYQAFKMPGAGNIFIAQADLTQNVCCTRAPTHNTRSSSSVPAHEITDELIQHGLDWLMRAAPRMNRGGLPRIRGAREQLSGRRGAPAPQRRAGGSRAVVQIRRLPAKGDARDGRGGLFLRSARRPCRRHAPHQSADARRNCAATLSNAAHSVRVRGHVESRTDSPSAFLECAAFAFRRTIVVEVALPAPKFLLHRAH